MKIKLQKVENYKWDIIAGKEIIGTCSMSYKYHGSYMAELNNGIVIHAFNQKSLKEMIEREMTK